MKTISITQLHADTRKWVQAARHESITVTDHGKPIAELHPIRPTPRGKFSERMWMKTPASDLDSTNLISTDRDEK